MWFLSGTFDTKDAGGGKAVTSTSSLSGAQKDNYTLTQPVGVTGTITPAGLTITADDQSKTYGQTLAFGSGATQFTSIGLQAWRNHRVGDPGVRTAVTRRRARRPIRSRPARPPAARSARNYTIGYVPGTLTVDKAEQTITFELLADRTYGDAPFVLTANGQLGSNSELCRFRSRGGERHGQYRDRPHGGCHDAHCQPGGRRQP